MDERLATALPVSLASSVLCLVRLLWLPQVTITLYGLAGIALWLWIDGYRVTSALPVTGPSNPMLKTAELQPGAWFTNYAAHVRLWLAPDAGFAGALLTLLGLRLRRELPALLGSALAIAGIVLGVGASMFLFILPSSIAPRANLMVWDSSLSRLTLFIMLMVTAVFIPLIVACTSWVHHVLRGKVDAEAIRDGRGHAY
jgi:cytochrome d ubiquinol oxidase subunit II